MKRLLKNNLGMTLMEILVALSLLMIVIVGTTPVMLQAYDGLYTAGEYTQDTYEAKSEIEDKLATRNTRDVYPGFTVNFNNLGEVATLNGRRAVSSLKGSLETLFTNARVRVAVISSKTVNDDYAGDGYHEVILQTTNLDFGTTDKYAAQAHLSVNNTDLIVDGGTYDPNDTAKNIKKVDVSFILPDKQANEGAVYTYKEGYLANVNYNNISVDPITGRIVININGFDFTQSPIKIYVAYLDENDKRQTTEAYLYVDTPTIIAAGETGTYDYYTSSGVQVKTVSTVDNSTGTVTKKQIENMDFYGRSMRTSGATGTQAIPTGTIFKSVNWITETTSGGDLVGSVYSPSYYVLTGTNGAIYRTYSFVKSGTVAGKVKLDTSDAQFNGIDQASMADVMGIVDKTLILDDRSATTVYPAVWGGDFSHIYGYSTYGTSMGYKDTDNWYTQSSKNSGIGQAGYYSNKANYGYYYNGWGMTFSAYTQNSKKISYILTERENALRVGGLMADPGNYDYGHNRIWERYYWQKADGSWTSENYETKNAKDAMETWYYHSKINGSTTKENHVRSAITELKEEGENYTDTGVSLNQIPTYFCDVGSSDDLNRRGDQGFAQIRIKVLTTLYPRFILERWTDAESDGYDGQLSSVKFVYNQNSNRSKITVTDAVYIPATTTTSAQVFYVGTVAAYSMIYQTDNADSGANNANRIYNNGSDNTGYVSSYWLMSSDDGTETTAYKFMASEKGTGMGGDHTVNRSLMNNTDVFPMLTEGTNTMLPGVWADEANQVSAKYNVTITGAKMNTDASREFFIPRSGGDSKAYGVKYALFTDLYFTMGFTSNREMVYSKIVYGNVNGVLEESFKYCEPLYYLSHYDDESHFANGYFNQTQYTKIAYEKESHDLYSDGYDHHNPTFEAYFNKPDNDYYNVWFPGEMYNLTKVATKEGITVAVGYAVSGSTYTYINPDQNTNSSTALSGIHNDGVLSAMVLGQDTSFTNLLYFKETENFDQKSLSDGSISYYSGDKEWDKLIGYDGADVGSNSRDSVQFTAVDIGIQRVTSGSTETSTYYAYYADNKGRVFRSKVATGTSTSSSGSVTIVSHIADQANDGTRSAPSYMEQLTLPNSKKFTDYFEAITKITVEGDLIFISGKPNQTATLTGIPVVVGIVNETTNAITWTVVYQQTTDTGYKNHWVEDMTVLNGYLYTVGRKGSAGFITAISIGDLRVNLMSASPATSYTYYQTLPTGETTKLYVEDVDQQLYAIAGK